MGTNYYLETQAPCECCKRPFERLHIGKSSGGWVFSLHVGRGDVGIPADLDEWETMWSQPGATILDEYGCVIAQADMRALIADRKPWRDGTALLRHDVDGRHCVGRGEGTWDCIVGEFS